MTIALGGRITVDGVLPSGNLAAGTVLFLHTSAGKLTATEPSGNNEVSKPMAVITYLNSEMIMIQQRGEVISTAGITLADGSVDNDAMADDAINTDEIVADAVTNAKLANMAAGTVKANATGSAANPTDVSLASATQATIAGDDVVLIYDTSATALATMTRTNFVAGVGSVNSKVQPFSRTASAGAGAQSFTDAGFTPTAIIVFAVESTGSYDCASWGFGDVAGGEGCFEVRDLKGTGAQASSRTGNLIFIGDGTNVMAAVLTSLDSAGCTITWTKTASGLDVAGHILYLR